MLATLDKARVVDDDEARAGFRLRLTGK